MSLTGGDSGPVINRSIRTVSLVTPGSAAARHGSDAKYNIDTVAQSRVSDATNNSRWVSSLYGSIGGGINNGLANAAAFQHGLYPSYSQPPSGVKGGFGAGPGAGPGPGAGSVNSGGAAKSTGGAGPQNTTPTNPNHNGLSHAQVSALNQQNKLPPELLAQMIADKTNKTEARRDPKLVEQGKPTEDPKLNEALEELGSKLEKKIKSFDQKLENLLKEMSDDDFKKEFKDSGFDTKKELHDFNAKMKQDVSEGKFDQQTYDKFTKFLDSVPETEKYKELKDEGTEIKDLYKKGLDQTQNELVAGNFLTAADEITKGDENKDDKSFLDSFLDQAGVEKGDNGEPNFTAEQKEKGMEDFYNLAKDSVEEARSKLSDDTTSAKEFDDHLQSGKFNDKITEMKKLHDGFKGDLTVPEGDKNYAEETMNNMMFMKASSPSSPRAAKMEAGIRDIQKENPGKELTRDDVLKNQTMKDTFFKPYYDEAFKDIPKPDNDIKLNDDNDSPEASNSKPISQESTENAVANLESSVSFSDDHDYLVATVDEPHVDVDLDLDIDIDDIDIA